MKPSIKLITVLSCLFLSFSGMSQISKTDLQQFIAAHAPSSVQKFFITRKVDYNPSANDFAKSDVVFDATSTTITFSDNSMRIKDGKGMDAIVPYSAVKYIAHQPETDKFYSSICIQME